MLCLNRVAVPYEAHQKTSAENVHFDNKNSIGRYLNFPMLFLCFILRVYRRLQSG